MHQQDVRALSKRSLPVLLGLALVACASSPEVEVGLAQPRAYEDVKVVEGEPAGSFIERGEVSGSVCYRSPFELQLKSKEAAIRDMRRQAVEMDANAIIRLDCQSKNERDWIKNCLATMRCAGTAVRVDGVR